MPPQLVLTDKHMQYLPLDEFQMLALARYFVRASSVENFTDEELDLRSDLNFPNRAKKNSSLKTTATFTSDLIDNCNINPRNNNNNNNNYSTYMAP